MTDTPAPLSYSPTARADLLTALSCTAEGLHLLAALYKGWSCQDPNPDWLAESDTIKPAQFRTDCATVNRDCRSLKSLIETRAAKESLRG